MAAHGASLLSTSIVENSLSSLKNCQAYIDTGMDIATGVALDLLQTGCEAAEVDGMESVMLEYATLNRDLNQYISAVEETLRKVKRHPPEEVPDLRQLVQTTYEAHQKKNTDEALRNNDKFIQFEDQLRDLKKQMGITQEETFEDDDEEIAVTQSFANFTCPITQMEMENPVKNKVCGHTYEKDAIVRMIESRHKNSKKARCPKIGCAMSDLQISDLVPDSALRRAIEIHKRQRQSQH
ncbi:E3 SUMO-protein ligase NSE2 isoform 1-T2 [Anomaloglossus baeobatrachus]|uniref:E3 SUMO-protein ligase NSE2 n=1 Tax=Anomaloglossus baeobatrachus TaxID=238106 RepID=UPI003F4F4DC7